jgi:hypothetical protein
VQPGGDGRLAAQAVCLADQRQEGGLEDVLGVLAVVQQVQGQSQDHGAVAVEQFREGVAVPLMGERLEQVAVGGVPAAFPGDQPAEGDSKRRRRVRDHGRILEGGRRCSYLLSVPARPSGLNFFRQ